MNELKIFNEEIIPVYKTDTSERVVLGRELHEKLGIKTPYDKWFPRMCEYGFEEFNEEIIPVYKTDTSERVVLGRELHEKLGIKTPYDKWFPRMCEYGFEEAKDFSTFLSESTGGRPKQEHLLKFDMAKHIAMIQRTPIGMAIRNKLIELEKAVKTYRHDPAHSNRNGNPKQAYRA